MFLKIGHTVHNLLQAQRIDLGDPKQPRVTLRFQGSDPVVLNDDASRKVRNFLTNGEARVIECSDLPDPTPEGDPNETVIADPPAKPATPEPAKEPATAAT